MKMEIYKIKYKQQKLKPECWIQVKLELKIIQPEGIIVAKQNIKVMYHEKK